ncbi:MAG: hypothetical protein N2323_04420 [candidate division WOR-3 bacterium]|nr:hypothetical protein [candidate division WOR-3 bacterium]MCX7837186.1 hypothetical protein [candidate division WOR-3 bacterium]MDW8114466.1 hypothetical protein [candidate division WOR-3 bacterium]
MKYVYLILFLITLGLFLIFYNFKYLPLEEKIVRISDENILWQKEVQELKERLREYEEEKEKLVYSFEFKELFLSETSDSLSPVGEAKLKAIIPSLKERDKKVAIIFYGEDIEFPTQIKKRYLTAYHYGFQKAVAVFNYLVNMGFLKDKLLIINDCEKKNKKNILELQVVNY